MTQYLQTTDDLRKHCETRILHGGHGAISSTQHIWLNDVGKQRPQRRSQHRIAEAEPQQNGNRVDEEPVICIG